MLENATTDPLVSLIANDNWMEFTVRYVTDFKKRRITRDALFTRILDEVERTDNQVSLASATYELVGAPPINVHLDGQPR